MVAYDLYKKGEYEKALDHIDQSEAYPENLGSGAPAHPDYRNQNILRAMIYQRTGDLEKARMANEAIQAYTERFGQMRGRNIFERKLTDTYVAPF